MTAVLSGGVQLLLPLNINDQMPDGVGDVWRRQQYHQMSLSAINNYWPESHTTAMGGVSDMDLTRFHAGSADYENTFHHDAGSLMSQPMGYVPDANWGSDMDIGTPSTTAGLSNDAMDGYHHMRHTSNPNHHLTLAQRYEHNFSVQSPQSSHDSGISPHLSYAQPPDAVIKEERPSLTRSITAPAASELRSRRGTMTACSGTSSIKRSGSEDEDDEYIPSEEAKPRGRKRQRIPHTAVERRYRENLNAHLDKLRQTVPSLASKRAAGNSKSGDGMGEGVKPSKCEILNGAIEHIGSLGKENAALKTEVKALRSRLEDLERWCNGPTHYGK